ncbi:MAG: hypothetical protein K2J85_01145, partial [Anaeroplasmataceae bacterium]|nr:hypothetical protein [Anaeroplasmataceae bacterium]
IIKDVTSILKNKKLGVSFSATYDAFTISGMAKLGLKENDPIEIALTIENEDLGLNEALTIFYVDSMFYVEYKQMKLKLSSLELMQFIKKYLPEKEELPKLNLEDSLNFISSIDFKAILKNLTIKSNEVFVSLDLSSLVEGLSKLDVQIEDTELGICLKSNLYGLSIDLDAVTDYSIELNRNEFVDIRGYLDLVDFLTNLTQDKSIGFSIDGTLTYADQTIGLISNINLYYKDSTYTVEAKATLTYLDKEVEVTLQYINKDLYITLYGVSVKMNLDTISSTIEEITNRLGVSLPQLETPEVNLEDILNLISNLKLGESSIEVDFSSILEILGVVG